MSIRNLINKPVTKDDIIRATRVIVRTGNVSPIVLTRHGIPYTKAVRIIAMLEGAKVVSPELAIGGRLVLLKNEEIAVNAALRRFNKGKKAR